jgi:hypothetical protein
VKTIKFPAVNLLKWHKKSKERRHLKKRIVNVDPTSYIYLVRNTRKVRKLLKQSNIKVNKRSIIDPTSQIVKQLIKEFNEIKELWQSENNRISR